MHDPIDEFRSVVASIAPLDEPAQARALKWHLLRALFRAADVERRSLVLDHQLGRALSERTIHAWRHEEAVTRLRVTHFSGAQLEAAEAAARAAEARCESLEELCRSLLRTIESATTEDTAPDTQPSATRPLGNPQ